MQEVFQAEIQALEGDGGMNREFVGKMMIVVPVSAFGLFCIAALIYAHPWVCLGIIGLAAYIGTACFLMNVKFYSDNGWYI